MTDKSLKVIRKRNEEMRRIGREMSPGEFIITGDSHNAMCSDIDALLAEVERLRKIDARINSLYVYPEFEAAAIRAELRRREDDRKERGAERSEDYGRDSS